MSQTRDPEVGEYAAVRPHNQPVSVPNQQLQPSPGGSIFGDTSGPLFSMYSKTAEEEDKEMAERWQKDADGLLIFTGLFSAAVAALLSMSVQNLIPNSQDTSSFYLGNIYEVLADPNATRSSIPPPIARPPPFSPPRFAIWVNSLWFLSLVISLTCALLATSSQQWARRYIRVTQPARCSPEKRARMRAFFSNGVEKTHIIWVVEGLPTLLHLSVFLFFGGVAIFLFNINYAVFNSVVWWIGLFLIVYGLITLMPILRHDSPYYSPLSLSAWFLYASISYISLEILFTIMSSMIADFRTWRRLRALTDRYRGWILGGVEKAAEETASKWSSKIDVHILGWTIDALNDDGRLEEFFEAIPGFFNSKLVKVLKNNFPVSLLEKFWKASDGFLDRTILSNSVTKLVKSRRLDIGLNAMNVISLPHLSSIPRDLLFQSWDQVPQNVEMGYTLAPWCTSDNKDIAQYAQCIVTRILASVRERDGRWIGLATRVLGLLERSLRDNIIHGNDSVSLAILASVARRDVRSTFFDWGILSTLSELNIHNTLSGQQHDFCTLWNEIIQEARKQGPDSYPVGVLRMTRLLYIGLHQGTHAAPTKFSDSTRELDRILFRPDSYPYCNIPSHHPDPTIPDSCAIPLSARPVDLPNELPHQPSSGGSGASRLVEESNVIAESPFPYDQAITGEIGDTSHSQAPPSTSLALPDHAILRPANGSPPACVASAPRNITLTSNISFTAPTSSFALPPAVPVPSEPLAPYDAGPASISTSLLLASSAITASHISPLPSAELFAILGGRSLTGPPDNATSRRSRPRGLINDGNMSCVNAVLQLLVYCPPFGDLLRDLGRQMVQHGQGRGQQTSGGTTTLVDATIRFLDEFVYREKPTLTQQSVQSAENGKAKEDEKEKKGDGDTDPFMPTYMYNAMMEKRQLKHILDGQEQDAEEVFYAFLDALDEELFARIASISTHRPAAAAPSVGKLKEKEVSHSGVGQIDVGKRDYIASSDKSFVSRIFNGRLETVAIEGWRSLQPDLIHTIQDALAYISQPQSVHVSSSGPGKASQQATTLIEALPSVLVLHLKRFLYDAATGGVVKIDKPVQFSRELEIPQDIMAHAAGRPPPPRYLLCGVLCHQGKSASKGHHTVYVLHPNAHCGNAETWLHIDDETVSTVNHEDVFRRQYNERADERHAYMLFYHRVASTQT